VSEADLACRRRMDEIFMQHPFFGSPRYGTSWPSSGAPSGAITYGRMMRRMGPATIYPKRRVSLPDREPGATRVCSATWRGCGRTKSGAAALSATRRCCTVRW
jgi:hypothetical protein